MNVSRALAWIGCESVAAGLWGRNDYEQMLAAMGKSSDLVQVTMTPVRGRTRLNITVVDTRGGREMHLRARSGLATQESLETLRGDLEQIVAAGDICAFSGAMPDGPLLEAAVGVVRACHEAGATLAVDTHGTALKSLVEAGLPWLIAPNVQELGDLLGSQLSDKPEDLAAAGRSLLGKVQMVLISRGENGAMVVTAEDIWAGRQKGCGKVLETVGCGDYLLAGFLASIAESQPIRTALEQGLKVATARAVGLAEEMTWPQATGRIEIETVALPN